VNTGRVKSQKGTAQVQPTTASYGECKYREKQERNAGIPSFLASSSAVNGERSTKEKGGHEKRPPFVD
jgi:hypothetical protein